MERRCRHRTDPGDGPTSIPPVRPHLSCVIEGWGPLLPAVAAAAYFVVGLGLFALRALIWGVPHDPEMDSRGGHSVLVGATMRNYFVWVLRPLWGLIVASGLSANAVTAVAAAIGIGSGIAVGLGHFALGGWLLLFSGILDALDGRLARVRGQVTPAGSALDSVLDRYVDAAVLIGLAWYFRDSWVLLPTLAALFGTSAVPYVRAKADSLGVPLKDGLMQRPERILYLGGTIAFSPLVEAALATPEPHQPHRLAIFGILLLAVTTNITAIGRLLRLMASLRSAPKPRTKSPVAAGPVATTLPLVSDGTMASREG